MKLLVVEDEAKAASYLQKGLGENGYVVDVASDGQMGLTQATAAGYADAVEDNWPECTGLITITGRIS